MKSTFIESLFRTDFEMFQASTSIEDLHKCFKGNHCLPVLWQEHDQSVGNKKFMHACTKILLRNIAEENTLSQYWISLLYFA